MTNTPVSPWKEFNNKRALTDAAYIESMHPDNGPKDIILALENCLVPGSSVFEFGIGPGRNILYLAEQGYEVAGQDVSDEMIRIFQTHAEKRGKIIRIEDCPAQDYTPSKIYDAFVCTYVLHFMPTEDALRVIDTMQKYTRPGGYNAFAMFGTEEGGYSCSIGSILSSIGGD